jgi:hypothetical protein
LIAKPIQGENNSTNKNPKKNLQHDLKTKPLKDKNHQDDPSDLVTDKQNQQQILLNQETNKP